MSFLCWDPDLGTWHIPNGLDPELHGEGTLATQDIRSWCEAAQPGWGCLDPRTHDQLGLSLGL